MNGRCPRVLRGGELLRPPTFVLLGWSRTPEQRRKPARGAHGSFAVSPYRPAGSRPLDPTHTCSRAPGGYGGGFKGGLSGLRPVVTSRGASRIRDRSTVARALYPSAAVLCIMARYRGSGG